MAEKVAVVKRVPDKTRFSSIIAQDGGGGHGYPKNTERKHRKEYKERKPGRKNVLGNFPILET
ncbi:hypothetical protein N6H14_08245 [Paenibacillus sp. CC-CFT747]|nr:hypothetical protein N6H14_08245 [Paenibacillus sp. CC-CFT747]